MHVPFPGPLGETAILRLQDGLERLELLHFAVFALVTLAILVDSTRRAPNLLLKKQLRIIVAGLAFGVLPSTVFYIVPFILGSRPSTGAELTVLLQALIPLVFSYSISRYRLVDIEVFLKKAATLTFSFFVIAFLYFFVSSRTRLFSENRLNAIVLGVLAIVLGATLFTPLKRMFQTLLDRAIYKRSYEYRKTLLSITRDLNRERNLGKLAPSLLEAIANALNLERVALFLADESDRRAFKVLQARGEGPALAGTRRLRRLAGRGRSGRGIGWRSSRRPNRSPPGRPWRSSRRAASSTSFRSRSRTRSSAAWPWARSTDGSYFSREDWELLTTISGSAALALENADLYGRETVRAMEMQRLKDYSENIIESLTVGVSVIDEAGPRHRLEQGPRGPGRRPEGGRARPHASRTSSARRPTGPSSPRRARRTSASSARSRWRWPAARRRSSTSPGRPCSTTPSSPTGPSSSSRTSPTRSASSSSS